MNSAGVIALVAVLVAATAFGLWRKRTDGRFAASKGLDTSTAAVARPAFTAHDLGVELGTAATLVQFTSAFCQPCRATKRTLERVADMVDGVVYAEVDAESQLELTRQFNVMRTPTVFILEPTGAVAHRAAGQPRFADVVAALGAVVPPDSGLPVEGQPQKATTRDASAGDPDLGQAQAAS
ncbi:MAG: thioredoxin family protein [Candidatus Nanopelagicales bacterium]|nr:thioredoxin family protein [Candidatus Nanopelagicales bacterium]